jgi:polysaccharide pyruvyl transferase CsaB
MLPGRNHWGEGRAMGASRQALLCGYYGEHNIGDDALLAALLQQLPSGWTPLVTGYDQAELEQRFGVATCPRRSLKAVLAALGRCQALVLGGGSLLQDATSWRSLLYYLALIGAARLSGKPVLLWGQGLGPLRRRSSRLLVRLALPLVTASSWRDPASAAQVRRWGVSCLEGSDPVWSLPPLAWRGSGGPIVLCFRSTPLLGPAQWRQVLEALAELATSSDRQVLWLPFHRGQDSGLLERLKAEGLVPEALAARSRECQVTSPEQAMQVFAGAGLVLAMRLHGLILAAQASAPCCALSYDPKVAAAAQAIACPCLDLERPLPAAPALVAPWQAQLDRPLAPELIDAQRQAAQVHGSLLQRLA